MPIDFPFQFRVLRSNEDLHLITTSNPPAILHLIEVFGLEEEIANDVKILLDRPSSARTEAIISLRSRPEEGENFAYTAILDCDLCGVRGGFFAVFKSFSGDSATLEKECGHMSDFLNGELKKEKHLEEFSGDSIADRYFSGAEN
jgi:hypothetical protein